MYLKYVQIKNFKNLASAKFEFSKGANTIIGENDSGKSNAMQAIRILLDSDYYYDSKHLKESDFSNALSDWKGHWIIISAYFDEITTDDKNDEICSSTIPEIENCDFLKSYIRCQGYDYGTVTLYIRPSNIIRKKLSEAKSREEFQKIREEITLFDYEFFYTSRSQADFLDEKIYNKIVGDIENGECVDPNEDDSSIIGDKVGILDIWKHISVVFVDALRDVESELRKPKNPLRRAFDSIQSEIRDYDRDEITNKIKELNSIISEIPQIFNIGGDINEKLKEIVGMVYSPSIGIESKLKADIQSLAKYLSVTPSGYKDIDMLGLGHLNILYIALKLVEFDYRRNHEILNIMIIEEPEAHIHTHIQRTLFENLKLSKDYTQVIMTTHSTYISEVADIRKVNVIKAGLPSSAVMKPTNNLDSFGNKFLNLKDLSLTNCLERYLDSKRSVLLFSKSVVLVEGDAEEIMLPAMIKKSLGVSLDELGIGVINIGSVSFEYIASIFDDSRIQKYCAIVTDYDAYMENASKSSEKAAQIGKNRKDKLDKLFKHNQWVESFYASYTFEIDFANEEKNRVYIEKIINQHYVQNKTIESHILNLSGNEYERYDTILTLANEIGKGWYATLLSSIIDEFVSVPEYLLKAVTFACQNIINNQIIKKMALHALSLYDHDQKIDSIIKKLKETNDEDLNDIFQDCCDLMNENDTFVKFFSFLGA